MWQLLSRFRRRLFYGWIIVASFLIIGIPILGIRLSFGIFLTSIEGEFSLTRAETTTVLSAYMIFSGLFAFLGGISLDRYGPKFSCIMMGIIACFSLLLTSRVNALWQLFATYSFLLAIGTSALYVVQSSTVAKWFDKKRGLALGIGGIGGGLGPVIIAPLATYLIYSFTWRTAYLVMGLATALMVIPLSLLLKSDPRKVGALPDGIDSNPVISQNEKGDIKPIRPKSVLSVFKTRSFWVIAGVWVFFAFSLYLVITHFVPHVIDMGFSAGQAAALFSLMGVSVIGGRILVGTASDRINRKLTGAVCALLQSAAVLWLIWAKDIWMLYIFALAYGFLHGGFGSCMAAIISETFELHIIGRVFGILEVGFSIGAAIGPTVGGIIFDVTQTYSLAFLITAASMLAVAVLLPLVRREWNAPVSK